jgi:CheY-like chemotaxis protein
MSKVLIIDDEPGILSLGQRIISRMGHDVTCAADSDVALARIAEADYQLILSDFNLPGTVSGVELARTLRERQPGSYIVIITGLADQARVAELAQAGVQHVLRKPFEVNELRRLVEQLLPSPEPAG